LYPKDEPKGSLGASPGSDLKLEMDSMSEDTRDYTTFLIAVDLALFVAAGVLGSFAIFCVV
jgi:hypothetical protein